jgi:hypothetical protein
MRVRIAFAVAVLAGTTTLVGGRQDAADPKGVVRIEGNVPDEKLAEKAPPSGVIVSAKTWDTVAAAWGLTPKSSTIDWNKTIFAVATTRGSNLKVTTKVTDGDLKITSTSTRDLRAGFRYELVSVPREGIKTVNGQPLPKE